MKLQIAWLAVFLLNTVAFSQGAFRNLDFEEPELPLTPVNGIVPAAKAIPGWTAYYNNNPTTGVLFNTVSLAAAAISIQGPESTFPSLQGAYTLGLQSDYNPLNNPFLTNSVSVGQVGQVPPSAKSITFLTATTASLLLTFEGNLIPLVITDTISDSVVMLTGDVSIYGGQTGDLRFIAASPGGGWLDGIQFSASSVPEPSLSAFFTVGALMLCRRLAAKNSTEQPPTEDRNSSIAKTTDTVLGLS